MIERDTKNELRGQMDLGDLMGEQGKGNREKGKGEAEGYDALGHLINPFLVAEALEEMRERHDLQ